MNPNIKNFFLGGFIVALCNYILDNLYVSDSNRFKYTAIITHGIPMVFLVTLFLSKSENKKGLIQEGFNVTFMLLILMGIFTFMINNINLDFNVVFAITILCGFAFYYYYLFIHN